MLAKLVLQFGLFHCLIYLASAQGPCTTPDGRSGICIPIRSCTVLMELLLRERGRAADYLRRSRCGYEFNIGNPTVCCPQQQQISPSGNQDNTGLSSVKSRYYPLNPPECGVSVNASFSKIVGGEPAKLGAWPWLALMGYRRPDAPSGIAWLCGGALISKRHVLTAAHCILPNLRVVRLGELVINDNGADGAKPIDVSVEKMTQHPEYANAENDIAIVRLGRDIQFTDYIRPICLPLQEPLRSSSFAGYNPLVAGWGSVKFRGPGSQALLQIEIPVVDNEQCLEAYSMTKGAVIDNRVLCAGLESGGKDACQGDSGGPLMIVRSKHVYTIGVVSYGRECARPGIPGVYSRVTYFLDFILENLV